MSVQAAAPAEEAVPDGDDLLIQIPADAPLEDEAPEPKPDTPAPVEATPPVEGLEDLQRQLAAERQEKERASESARKSEQERQRFAAMAQDYQRRGMSAEEALFETQITVAQSALEAAKKDYKNFLEAGEYEKVADAQERISTAAADKRMLEHQKAAFVHQRSQQPVPQQTPSDPIEAAIAAYTPATQAWLRSHRDVFRSDGQLKRKVIEAHEAALDEGHAPDTPGYFAKVEELIKPVEPAPVQVQPKLQGRPPSVAAPVARASLPSASKIGPNGEFRLTPKMRTLAESAGAPDTISYADWAREYLRMVSAGEMQPIE